MTKPKIQLQDLITQGNATITATSTLLGQKLAVLDCSGITALDSSQIESLFSGIPKVWEFVELVEVIVV